MSMYEEADVTDKTVSKEELMKDDEEEAKAEKKAAPLPMVSGIRRSP